MTWRIAALNADEAHDPQEVEYQLVDLDVVGCITRRDALIYGAESGLRARLTEALAHPMCTVAEEVTVMTIINEGDDVDV